MARVSKQSLTQAQENELIVQLTDLLGRISAHVAEHFIFEFFGREEKIMLAKRLAIIALIHERRSLHRIATQLHVSEATVGKLYDRYKKGDFENTLKALNGNKTDYIKFLDLLDSILTVGGIMPYRNYVIKSKR